MDRPTATRKWIVPVVVSGLVVAGIVIWGVFTDRGGAPTPTDAENSLSAVNGLPVLPARPDGYVGTETCRECHPRIAADWQTHPMSRSASTIAAATPLEDYSGVSTVEVTQHRQYQVERLGDSATHREIHKDVDGQLLYEDSVPVQFLIGSGQKGRSYLSHRGNGLLFMSPVTWYTGQQRFGLSPGYGEQREIRFSRRIVDGCLQCHVGRVQSVGSNSNRYDPALPIEPAIGCERCHGPGEDHIHFQRHDGSHPDGDPIVRLGDLDAARQESICLQCHLQGVERILRYSRSEFDFRPGDHVNEIWTTFVLNDGDVGGTTAVSHVEQIRMSRCYQASGKLTCASCHNHHRHIREDERVVWYRERCLVCHGTDSVDCAIPADQRAESPQENSCVDCHMQNLTTTDVPHTAQTDHRIRRRPPQSVRDVHATTEHRIFDREAVEISELQVRRARALFVALQVRRERDPLKAAEVLPELSALAEILPEDIDIQVALGIVLIEISHLDRAIRVLETAICLNPKHETALSQLVIACHESGRSEAGLKYADRLIAINPWDVEWFGRQAHMFGHLNRFEEGIAAAHRGLKVGPSSHLLHAWLAEAYERTGNPEKGRHHWAMHKALDKKH